jgi:hypothetical protein
MLRIWELQSHALEHHLRSTVSSSCPDATTVRYSGTAQPKLTKLYECVYKAQLYLAGFFTGGACRQL